MFQFAGLLSHRLCIHLWIPVHYYRWVSPFGNLRFIGYVLLHVAYRSLSRPSSASSAKASTLCSLLLNLFTCLFSFSVPSLRLHSLTYLSTLSRSSSLHARITSKILRDLIVNFTIIKNLVFLIFLVSRLKSFTLAFRKTFVLFLSA